MPSPDDLKKFGNRSASQAPPVPGFELSPFPKRIVEAFPDLEDWRKAQNQRIADYTKKLNTVIPPQLTV